MKKIAIALATVAARLQTQVKARVLMGLPFGHVATKVVLPVGQRVTLAVEGRDAFLEVRREKL